MMNFLNEIKCKNVNLKPVQTRVTRPDGKVYLETFGKTTENVSENACEGEFFVLDTKPDEELHEVLPGLFVGSQDASSNFKGLAELGITHILNVGCTAGTKIDHISYRYMPIYDIPEFRIKEYFRDSITYIRDGLKCGSVLVHCNAGISRSSTIAAAYIMKENGESLDSALELVKRARPIAKPNPGFMKQLRMFEKELFGEKIKTDSKKVVS